MGPNAKPNLHARIVWCRKVIAMDDRILPERLYKYTSADTACKILRTGRMLWSSVLMFNDLHEGRVSHDELKRNLAPLMHDKMHQLLSVSKRPRLVRYSPNMEAWVQCWRPKWRDPLTRADAEAEIDGASERLLARLELEEKRYSDLAEECHRMSRVVCFSEISDNVKMWAHYSDDNRGVVLEFDPRRDEELKTAEQIHYSEKPVSFADPEFMAAWLCGLRTDEQNNEQISARIDRIHVTKSLDWEHEREWRCITGGPAMALRKECTDLIQYSRQAMRRIVFGHRISTDDRDRILRLVEEKEMSHVEISEAAPSTTGYGLEITTSVRA